MSNSRMTMRGVSLVCLGLLMVGCARSGSVRLTPGVGVETLPTAIALYPLLTTEAPAADWPVKTLREGSADTSVDHGRIYIQPPTETKLVVTLTSQQMTDMLLAEFSSQGFKVKELPIEVPQDRGEDEAVAPTFYVSVALLEHLKEDFDLQALMIGNVYFSRDRHGMRVTAAHMRLVDIETLDVLCHVTVDGGDFSLEVEDCVQDIAKQFAQLAGLKNGSR